MCYRKLAKKQVLIFLLTFLVFYRLSKWFNHAPQSKNNVQYQQYLETLNQDWKSTFASFKNYSRRFTLMRKSPKEKDLLDDTTTQKQNFEQVECYVAPFLLILVHSKPNNFLRRQAIRKSWGKQDYSLQRLHKRSYKTVFLLGQIKGTATQRYVGFESRESRDIVVGDFIDSYANLYKKMLLTITWPLHECRAKYILKTDDDCYVNIGICLSFLIEYDSKESKPLYTGRIASSSPIERDQTNKHYLPEDIYPSRELYPPYIAGGGYLFSGSLLEKLKRASKTSHLFPIEDACFGSLMRKAGVEPEDNLRFMPFLYCYLLDDNEDLFARPLCDFVGPIVIHGLRHYEQITMHFQIKLMTLNPSLCQGNENGWLETRKICT